MDPFCGSGTFPIEAAMMAANIAPGMNRSFTAESWMNIIPKKVWYDTIDEANDSMIRLRRISRDMILMGMLCGWQDRMQRMQVWII